ncbi:MAG: MBL fold metallo-hydrolase [Myxococcota bacterium]
MKIEAFFDERTSTLTYVVYDPGSKDAIVIDPVLDYEPAASKKWTESIDRVLDFITAESLKVHFVVETHADADHLSGSQLIKERIPSARSVIGRGSTTVQRVFKDVFDVPDDFPTDGRQFDLLMDDGQVLKAGTLSFEAILTSGHTPADVTFKVEDAIFTGDLLFMPDYGTGRCDFPAGSAGDLYDSIHNRLYTLPDETRVFVGHDYQPDGREVRYETTIGESKKSNVHIRAETSREEFTRFRNERDKTRSSPGLLFQSVQVNVDAGRLPQPSDNQMRYLKILINAFRPQEVGEMSLEPAP